MAGLRWSGGGGPSGPRAGAAGRRGALFRP